MSLLQVQELKKVYSNRFGKKISWKPWRIFLFLLKVENILPLWANRVLAKQPY